MISEPTDDDKPVPVQLIRLDDLPGRTVARAVKVEGDDDAIVLVFTDGYYLAVCLKAGWDNEAWIVIEEALGLRAKVAAGVATATDRELIREFDASADRYRAAQERREYERLRAKFEGEGKSDA